jgi:hypothetical protein
MLDSGSEFPMGFNSADDFTGIDPLSRPPSGEFRNSEMLHHLRLASDGSWTTPKIGTVELRHSFA